MADVSLQARILYVIWKRPFGFGANYSKLKEALHYKGESQLRHEVEELIAVKMLELRPKANSKGKWFVTEQGLYRIRFLTLSFIAVGLLLSFGVATIISGVLFSFLKMPLQPLGQIGVGIVVAVFAIFMWRIRQTADVDVLKVESRDKPSEG